MEPDIIIATAVAIVATLALAVVAATETALERANDVRIRAYAVHGDVRAQRIVGTTEQPQRFLGPLTAARVALASTALLAAAYTGLQTIGGETGVVVYGIGWMIIIMIVQLGAGVLAARRPEATALGFSVPASIAGTLFYAPALILQLPGLLFGKLLSPVAFEEPEDEDILSLVERQEAAGGVEEQEQRMIRGIIKLEDTTAHEIMVPRIDVAAVDIEDGIDGVVPLVLERGFSRIPVYRETVDDIIGIVYAKDLLRHLTNGRDGTSLSELLRDPMFVPESKRLDELLAEMRAKRTHIAVVVDEYGGTAGLVTIEDLLEEIVGEIEDEYDVGAPPVEQISEDEVVLDASTPTAILAELFSYRVDNEDFDTVGGLLIHELGRLPTVGDSVAVDGLTLKVLSMVGRRIRRIRITRTRADAEVDEAGARAEAS